MGKYLPEGRMRLCGAGAEAALHADETVEGRAVRCTLGHDLVVDMGGAEGIIPRSEAALGIDGGRVREIAVLSRVGKRVCFKVQGRDGGRWVLSRARAQAEALRFYMDEAQTGQVIEGRVTRLEGFGAFVDIGCGISSMIGIENISVSRIAHPRERFSEGQDIYCVLSGRDRALGRITLTHKELLGKWSENAALVRAGETVSGTVRGVEDYGVFVELRPNLSGLAEKRAGISCGDHVSVYVKSASPERMKIKLVIIGKSDFGGGQISESDYFITDGVIKRWRYSPPECTDRITETVFV